MDEPMNVLELDALTAGYDGITAIRDVSLTVRPHEVVAVLGANGAGKSTLLRTAAGILRPTTGRVRIDGVDVTASAPYRRAEAGLCLIPEGRGVFRNLSVAQNLQLQAGARRSLAASIERVAEVFPSLRDRLSMNAGALSGGQQQMLALARAYVCDPRAVLIDEVSMGLAPVVVDDIFTALETLARSGTAIILVEQYIARALAMADTVLLLAKGSVAYAGPADGIDERAVLRDYVGAAVE